jgi:hypothetical protein
MKIAFTAFATSNWSKTLKRIEEEATAMKCFDKIWCLTEQNLDGEFLQKHWIWMTQMHPLGFGAWIWKSQCVKQALRQLEDGDALLYADAGCVLHSEGVPRLKEYIQMAKDSPHKNVSFSLGTPEKQWTKGDVFHALNYTDLDSDQLMATTFILIKTPEIVDLVNRWQSYCEQYRLVGHFPSSLPNDPTYQDQRHDQSIFSIMRKQFGTVILSDETWWPNNWDDRKDYPIHARRLKY